jgi:hypothetical protein
MTWELIVGLIVSEKVKIIPTHFCEKGYRRILGKTIIPLFFTSVFQYL